MICFQNDGLIDLRGVKTVGLNAKPKTGAAIGEFGTGLKLAIAVILRTGGRITIWRGRAPHQFAVRRARFRGERVKMITMDGEDLNFTLNYGKNWETWQAFRELYSNMLDEPNGRCFEAEGRASDAAEPRRTTIVVDHPDFHELNRNRRQVFLEGEPRSEAGGVEVWDGETRSVFYKGMRASSLGKPALFTYNILQSMSLTEDRTFAYQHMVPFYVARAVAQSQDVHFINEVLGAHPSQWEASLDFDLYSHDDVSEQFLEVAAARRRRGEEMSPAAEKLFTERATQMSSHGLSEVRAPSQAEVYCFEHAMGMLRRLVPDLPHLTPVVFNNQDLRDVEVREGRAKLPADSARIDLVDMAARLAAAMAPGDSREDLARAILLGSFVTPEEEQPRAETRASSAA